MALALTLAEQAITKNLQDITLLQTQAKVIFTRIQDQFSNGISQKKVINGKPEDVSIVSSDEIKAAWMATGKLTDLQNTQTALTPLLT